MKSTQHFTKKKRQFSFLTKKINQLLKTGQFYQLTDATRNKLTARLRRLYEGLMRVMPITRIRRKLAGAAVLLGLSMSTQAQNFAAPVTNPFELTGSLNLKFPTLADIDGDGDMDILSVTYTDAFGGKFEFRENTGTIDAPIFDAAPVENPFGINLSSISQAIPWDFDLADMDNDGDLDMLVGSSIDYDNYYGGFNYYENTGNATNPQFSDPIENPFGLTNLYDLVFPSLVDIDGDGDVDVFATDYYGIVNYAENIGSAENPSFAAFVPGAFNLTTSSSDDLFFLAFGDLDHDGDIDVIGSGYGYDDSFLAYQENTGTASAPVFGTVSLDVNPLDYTLDITSLAFMDIADMDGDGDEDLLMNEYNVDTYSNNWLYFENTAATIDAANELANEVELNIFPNPVQDVLYLQANFEALVDYLKIEIHSADGKLVFQKEESQFSGNLNESFNTLSFPAGFYFIKIRADEKFSTLKFFKS